MDAPADINKSHGVGIIPTLESSRTVLLVVLIFRAASLSRAAKNSFGEELNLWERQPFLSARHA